MYEYKAIYIYNYDGDTVDLVVDLGFNISFEIKVRMLGIDAYELKDKANKELSYKAKDYVKDKLSNASEIIVKTKKDTTEKYGRYLATIFYDSINLNEELVKLGLAKEY